MLQEKRLIWRCKQGDGDALERIYRLYKLDMLSLAASLTRDSSLAEDVVHDVFVSFAEHAEKLQLRSSLRSYLLSSVANRVRNLHKAKVNQAQPLKTEVAASGLDSWPDQVAISAETAGQIARALAELPDEQREVIVLRLQGQLKFKTIARIQQASINTVNSRYRYGLEKLRDLLDGEIKS